MKLLTHNMLTSNILKGVKSGFPLLIEASEVKEVSVDFNPEFIARTVPKLEWPAVVAGATNIGREALVPVEVPGDFETSEDFLKKAHHVLLELEVQEGFLVCPETGRKFPVTNGIPNMLLNEGEV